MGSSRRGSKTRKTSKPALRLKGEEYTQEEKDRILKYVDDEVTVPRLKAFLADHELPRSGNKPDLLKAITDAIGDGDHHLDYPHVVELLDAVLPWGPQHVFLLGEPRRGETPVATYRNRETFEAHLREKASSRPFRAPLPLVLPEELTVSSIVHTGEKLRVTAIERRDGFMREENLDRVEERNGETVHFRAFVEETTRGLIMFEWNFTTNVAMLQITRLPAGQDYAKAETRFIKLVSKWIDLTRFPRIRLGQAISTVYNEAIKLGDTARARPHGVEWETIGGSRLQGKSATSQVSLVDDQAAKDAMDIGRDNGTGRTGNLYWQDVPDLPDEHRGIHVKVLAHASRIHFPTGQTEETMRHVLEEIRKAC